MKDAVVTSGTFDGVHLGHQKILSRLTSTAGQIGGESVIITFWPHPRLVLYPEQHDLKLLSTFEEKAATLEKLGIQHILKIEFTKEFSKLSSQQFIQKVLIDTLATKKLIIGYDHRFGRNREGSFDHLQANASNYGFEVEEIPAKDIDSVNVSSSRIRACLTNGDVKTSMDYLGRPYSLSGTVVGGDQIGRKLGFPTANIKVNSELKLIPKPGIYAVKVMVQDQKKNGMLYIGNRPTVDGADMKIEVNIFDFDRDIYEHNVSVYFYDQIREDERFDSLEALSEKLKSDKIAAEKVLKQTNHGV